MRAVLTAFVLLAIATPVPATLPRPGAQETAFDLDAIFSRGVWDAAGLEAVHWTDAGHYGIPEPSTTFNGAHDLVRVRASDGTREMLVSAGRLIPATAERPLVIDDWQLSADGGALLLAAHDSGDPTDRGPREFWLYERRSGGLRRIDPEAPAGSVRHGRFSPDGTRVAYVRDHDLWIDDRRTGAVTRLTSDGSHTLRNGVGNWLYENGLGLTRAFRWSPDSRSIAFWQFDDELVNDHPAAGGVNPAARIGVIPAGGGEIVWIRLPGSARDHYAVGMEWAGNPRELVVQQLTRSQNTLRLWLADATNGSTREILRETDEAWVEVRDELRWIDGGRAFLWPSERDGWRRLYRVTRTGSSIRALTPPGVDMISLEGLDEAGGRVWYRASPDDPTRAVLWQAPLDPDPTAAAPATAPAPGGSHRYTFAPGARWAFHERSDFASPPGVDLVELPSHRVVRTLVDNGDLRNRIASLGLRHRFVRIEVEPGVNLDSWQLLPPDFDAARRWPVLLVVGGDPSVRDHWAGRRRLWHYWLARHGWVVMAVDGRGTSAPRGREWRRGLRGEEGGRAAAEQANALRAFAAEHRWVDLDRIGAWGWGDGASVVLDLMFRHPERVGAGIAVAPLADRRMGATLLQERTLGRPQDAPSTYTDASPLNWAHRLEGALLLVHGTADDLVPYAATEALVDRLIAAGKPFRLMPYPDRGHSISEGDGTTRHLYELMTRFLHENLAPGY